MESQLEWCGTFGALQGKRDAEKWWESSRGPPRWLGLGCVMYEVSEGVCFVQHGGQKAESI